MENEQVETEFEKLAKPIIEYLNKNYHPHVSVIITPTSAEVLSGEEAIYTEEFIED